ncbi:MAG: hypothetical protein ACYSU8_00940 [Planctomycetota bacterium]
MKKQSLRCILIGSLFCLSACGAQAAPATASETKMSIQNTEKREASGNYANANDGRSSKRKRAADAGGYISENNP